MLLDTYAVPRVSFLMLVSGHEWQATCGSDRRERTMRSRQAAGLLVVLIALTVLAIGCGSEDGSSAMSADEHFAAGMNLMEDEMSGMDLDGEPWDWGIDLSDAMAHFDDALDEDPDHCGALLFSAVARLAMVVTDPDLGPMMEDLFGDRRGLSGVPGLFWYLRTPDIEGAVRGLANSRDYLVWSDIQEYMIDEVMPALDYADSRLTAFEALGCEMVFEFDVPDADEVIPVEIDATDAYFVHAPLDLVQSLCNMLVSYNVDMEDGETLQHLLEQDEDFLTLNNALYVTGAYDEMLEMTEHLEHACDSMEAETDDQSDDIFTETDGYLPLDDVFEEPALPIIRGIAGDIEEALVSGVTFNLQDVFDGDPEAPDLEITVDLEEYFTDPWTDIRDYFPDLEWESADELELERPMHFDDPTLDGVLPGMTNADWELIADWQD